MLDLIVVTGASRGIGKSIAQKCSNITNNLIGIARNINDLEIPNKQCKLIKLQGDLFYFKDLQEKMQDEVRQIDNLFNEIGLVLGGGTIGDPGGIFDTDLGSWRFVYETNVLGNLSIIKSFQEYLEKGIKLRIVMFAGGGAAYGYPDFSSYALSKVATVRAVENVSMEFDKRGYNASIIALAPGAVDTDILKKVIKHGGYVKTKTDISEPTNFVYNFLQGKMPDKEMNGRFIHVREDLESVDFSNKELFTLRRVQ